jgi:streptolysin S family bacteriocin protoxin
VDNSNPEYFENVLANVMSHLTVLLLLLRCCCCCCCCCCCSAAAAAAAADAAAEYWVDNLNPEYLEKALANVMAQVMGALWGLLKPSTTMRPHAVTAMQLLGKLGKHGGDEAMP